MTEKITDEELADLLRRSKEHMVWAFVQRRLSWHSVALMCSPLLLQSYRNIGTPLSELQHDRATERAYSELQQAFDFYNQRLFDGELD
jgi:hypothetical protein